MNVIIDNEEIDILTIRNNEAWIIEIKTSPVTRKDIIHFEKKSEKISGYKRKHRILIALATISYDAIQQAIQRGISIWTKHKIKKLLR